MKKIVLIPILLLVISASPDKKGFRSTQRKFKRVETAYSEKWNDLKSKLFSSGYDTNSVKIFIRAFKKEEQLELWVTDKNHKGFQLFKTYNICSSSGTLGPKRREGDLQVPEGFYHIKVFNPQSSYYLSLGINYPNKSDAILGKKPLGGNIMIHGDCVTIGCIPLTDPLIKEVYVLAVEAKNNGQQNIQVHIFPFRMTDANLNKYSSNKLFNFWKNIAIGYNKFEATKSLPGVTVAANGNYLFE